jgi:mono/diheme cytochrome c family protein
LDESIPVIDPSGVIRTQTWHYPSRAECVACHTPAAGYALGFNAAQLNRDVSSRGALTNQLGVLSQAGYFQPQVRYPAGLPALVASNNEIISREYRVRSYLAANCSQCHQPGGPARGQWDARLGTPLRSAGIIDGALFDLEGDSANRVVVRGDLKHSMLYTRISQLGPTHMPPISTSVLDSNAVDLIREWITADLPVERTFSDWQLAFFGSTNLAAARPNADPDGDGASNLFEFLTGSNPQDPGSVWRVVLSRTDGAVQISFPQLANRGFLVETTTDLSLPIDWETLEVPGNQIAFRAQSQITTLLDTQPAALTRFYRVRIFEP